MSFLEVETPRRGELAPKKLLEQVRTEVVAALLADDEELGGPDEYADLIRAVDVARQTTESSQQAKTEQ